MLAKRVIPVLLQRGHTLVKGRGYDSWRSVGVAQQAMRVHAARGVDELVYLDIGATPEGRGPDFALVEKLTAGFFTPITVGGGIRTLADIRGLLNAGADKVLIGTAAWEPGFVREASQKFGAQAIAVSVDYKNIHGIPTCVSHCGRVLRHESPIKFAHGMQNEGAGEILLSAIDLDGSLTGYDLRTLSEVAAALTIPVVAAGGCSGPEDMHQALANGAAAVAAGALFQFTDCTPKAASEYLKTKGWEIRL